MKKKIIVHDKMQSNYVYFLTVGAGKNFEPDFKPELSPKEMLQMGVFEGKYINECIGEFPRSWFMRAQISDTAPNPALNCFGIKSRQPLKVWQQKGWIIPPDVRGWFQWYCRYYMGRRIPNVDAIQIKRWKSFARHRAQIIKNCNSNDINCRKKQRQALLQWAYNPFI